MSTEEEVPREPPKNRAITVLGYVAIAVLAFGGGVLLESQRAEQTQAAQKLAHDQELKQAADKADQEKKVLNDSLAKEREEHAKDIQTKDQHLATFSGHANGVRRALEADLSAARNSGEACTARIDGITKAVGGVFDSIGEVTGLAQDIGRENQQLKEDNKSLSEKLAGWQKWNTERTSQITVIGKKTN